MWCESDHTVSGARARPPPSAADRRPPAGDRAEVGGFSPPGPTHLWAVSAAPETSGRAAHAYQRETAATIGEDMKRVALLITVAALGALGSLGASALAAGKAPAMIGTRHTS